MRSGHQIHCAIAEKSVTVAVRAGGGFREPDGVYVRCSERDCQYVDLNRPPCPLRPNMFVAASDRDIALYLSARAGEKACYPCIAAALRVTHADVRRAIWRLDGQPGVSVRPSRCSVCERRGVTVEIASDGVLAIPEIAATHSGASATETKVTAGPLPEASSPVDGRSRVMTWLRRAGEAAHCDGCIALATDHGLAEVRGALESLHALAGISFGEGECHGCGRLKRVVRWRSPRPGSVTVVDDNAVARYATSRLLITAGYRVAEAETGEAALSMLEEDPSSLYLLDLRLPGMNGFEVCEVIKRRKPEARVLTLTNVYRDEVHQRRALEAGADGFLTRPIDNADLLGAVAMFFPQTRARD
jgi:CheY-like chemotaxis protein